MHESELDDLECAVSPPPSSLTSNPSATPSSVHRIPSSLLGTVGAFTEMHAVQLAEPNNQHIAKVDGHDEEAAYRAASILFSRP